MKLGSRQLTRQRLRVVRENETARYENNVVLHGITSEDFSAEKRKPIKS